MLCAKIILFPFPNEETGTQRTCVMDQRLYQLVMLFILSLLFVVFV